jgi:hypothetical protein
MPLLDQRWSPSSTLPSGAGIVPGHAQLPSGSQVGARWSRVQDRYEYALSFFQGYNNAPTLVPAVAVVPTDRGLTADGSSVAQVPDPTPVPVPLVRLDRRYQALRSYGADLAVPTPWLTLKAEAALFTAPDADSDEFALYVVQVERQVGEWLLIGGYADEVTTEDRGIPLFMPERGMTRAFIGKASVTIDSRRSASAEAAIRRDGAGVYVKGELSQAYGQHWRATVAGVVLRGEAGDFIGQFHRNSHALASLRYSF